MRCLVRIPWMYSIMSLSEIPEDLEGLTSQGLEIEEGAWVEVTADVADGPRNYDQLAERTLGRCRTDPKHYRVFKTREGADLAGFEPTGMSYGGAYTPAMWAKLTTALPQMKAFHEIPDDDPPGAVEQALSYLRRDR